MAVEPNVRVSVPHLQGAEPWERDAVELVASCVESWEKGIGPNLRDRLNRFYRQYRSFSRFESAWIQAGPNDRDVVLYDAKKTWGASLHIPLSFRTIETMVPRAIAHRPRMLYLPRQERWAENVESVRLLIDAQQDNIDIDLPFQAVMRSGRIYGLGVGKTYWRKEYAPKRVVKKRYVRMPRQSPYTLGRLESECIFDDPVFEDVDIFDFMWDPFGSDMQTCGWTLHRTWLGLEAIMQRIQSGAWATPSVQWLIEQGAEEKLRSMGNGQKYDEIWADRMEASGLGNVRAAERGEQIHEVWEWHNGHRVFTVLDRQVLVQDAENPCVGRMPFQVYRPTPLQKQMVGIGDLEPLEHLQRELDTLRSQRRDAATLALAAGYVYDDGAIEPEDLQWGPHAAIRVTNARPSEAIMPIPVKEPPGTSYQEEQIIRQDFDVVPGINDAMDPQRSQVSTATEAQLIQASLSARIELASRRFEIEVVRQAARNFLRLDQRMITEDRDPIRQPDHGLDQTQAMLEGRWRWFPVGPGAIQGEFEIVPEGGSMAARNIPQDRQDAAQIMQIFGGSPYIDQRRPILKALELFGEKDAAAWLKRDDPPVPPAALEALQRAGVSPELIQRAVAVAQRADPRLPDPGPDVQQVNQMMGTAEGAPA